MYHALQQQAEQEYALGYADGRAECERRMLEVTYEMGYETGREPEATLDDLRERRASSRRGPPASAS